MGIQGLQTFVQNYRSQNWKHPRSSRGQCEIFSREKIYKLVIDGSGLCFNLYLENHPWVYGGEYYEFYKTVTGYFLYLQEQKIEPIVILDGTDSKTDTEVEKAKRAKRNHIVAHSNPKQRDQGVLPLFAKDVLIHAMRVLKIEFCVADGRADPYIAAVANDLQCPVLSGDSDFCIFDLRYGFVSLKDSHTLHQRVPVYHRSSFLSFHKIRCPELLYLLAVFLSKDNVKKVHAPEYDKVWKVIDAIQMFKSVESFFECYKHARWSAAAKTRYAEIYEFYHIEDQTFESLRTSLPPYIRDQDFPDWMIAKYKEGHIPPMLVCLKAFKQFIFGSMVEDIDRDSAYVIGTEIRQIIYGFLMGSSNVTEIIRKKGKCEVDAVSINSAPNCCNITLLDMDNLEKMATKDQIILSAFQFSFVSQKHESIFNDLQVWKLVVIATQYWYKKISTTLEDVPPKVKLEFAKGLVLCFLTCSGTISLPKMSPDHCSYTSYSYFHQFLHAFAQWQLLYSHAITLNQLLGKTVSEEPYKSTEIASLFSSRITLHYVMLCGERDSDIDAILGKESLERRNFDALMSLITDQSDNSRGKKRKIDSVCDPPQLKKRSL